MCIEKHRMCRTGLLVVLASMSWASAVASANDADRIRPYSRNPYYWQYEGKPILLLGGSWQDNLFNHPLGLERHLDLLVSVGGNYLRNTMSHRNQGNVFAYAQRDGKFDLDEFNAEYWRRLDDFLRMTHERDIIVQIEIFDCYDHFLNHQSFGGWSRHPFNPANNVTFTPEDSGLPTSIDYSPGGTPSKHPFWLAVPALENNELVLRYQRAYVDKLLSIALEYPHLLYCIQNESGEELAFGDYWADHVHRQAEKAGRAVFVTDMRSTANPRAAAQRHLMDNPQRYTFLDISQSAWNYNTAIHVRRYIADHPRPINSTKLYNDQGDEVSVARMFRLIFAGGASARFHRPHPLELPDAHEKATKLGLGLSPRAQVSIRSARMLTDTMDLFVCVPHNDLLRERSSDEAYCLAEPARQYAVYFPDGGAAQLDVSKAKGSLQVRWLDIDRSAWREPQTVAGGGTLELKTPAKGHWAVLVLRQP
jgi:hypothetical protein